MSETNIAGSGGGGIGNYFSGSLRRPMSSVGTTPDRRWQSESDYVNQYPEVVANSIDDELDESVFGRMWSVRGFGQAWHWLREKRRDASTPLNAYLTYVTLPWTSMLDGLIDKICI
jgi:hypothetical protein